MVSKTIAVRFSKKEIDLIQASMKKHKIKSLTDFIRTCTGVFIGLTEGMTAVARSQAVNSALNQYRTDLKTELDKVPPTKAKLQGKTEVLEKTVLPIIENEIAKSTERVEPFAKVRKAGRPNKPKRKRGDRKEMGYDKKS